MKVLEGRLEDFSAEARLLEVMLGLLSLGLRVEALSGVRRVDATIGPDGELANFFLGVISATRTLRATVGSVGAAAEPDRHSPPRCDRLSDVLSLR